MLVIQEQDNQLVLRFSKGEEFKKAFEAFLKERGIKGGFFYGLGGAISGRLRYYHLVSKEYETTEFSAEFSAQHFEVSNITGNVAQKKGVSIIHAHATLAGKDLKTFGGDISELIVGGTLEVFLTILKPMERDLDAESGLSVLTSSKF